MRLVLAVLLMVAATALAEDNAVERSLQKTGKAIEHGAKSAGRALDRTGNNVAKGAEKVHDKIDDKVRPKKK
ncbi:MAG TPA: hypothetical protein VFV84_02955 [Burkholderiales bacterium]|nr:hypothetical protein [Burkholderiales bacterium]